MDPEDSPVPGIKPIGIDDVLKNCNSSRDFATALGLDTANTGTRRIKFRHPQTKQLYRKVLDKAKDIAKISTNEELRTYRDQLQYKETRVAFWLDRFREIWNRGERIHLITSRKGTLYPSALFFDQEEDRTRIKMILHHWIVYSAIRMPSYPASDAYRRAVMEEDEVPPDLSNMEIFDPRDLPLLAHGTPDPLSFEMTSYGAVGHNAIEHRDPAATATAVERPSITIKAGKASGSTYWMRSRGGPFHFDLSSEDEDEDYSGGTLSRDSEASQSSYDGPPGDVDSGWREHHARKRKRDQYMESTQCVSTQSKTKIVKLKLSNVSLMLLQRRSQSSLGTTLPLDHSALLPHSTVDAALNSTSCVPNQQEALVTERGAEMDDESHSECADPSIQSDGGIVADIRSRRQQLLQHLQAMFRFGHPDIAGVRELDILLGNQLFAKYWRAAQECNAYLENAYLHWKNLHIRLGDFWKCTNFTGGNREAWKTYKSGLRGQDMSRLDILHAAAELDAWVNATKDDGLWAERHQLDKDLAQFFCNLVQNPNCDPEDFEYCFEGYNRELLAWYT